jgi:ElaB/YqjD/DUF883 family membrane-anchored ribosome-binding protein
MESDMSKDPNRPLAAGPGTTTPKDLRSRSTEVYDQTKQAFTQAYDRTAETLTGTYDQAMTYGRENPGKLALIAFGAGLGFGLMMISGRRSRTRRYGEPIVNALADMALEFLRR